MLLSLQLCSRFIFIIIRISYHHSKSLVLHFLSCIPYSVRSVQYYSLMIRLSCLPQRLQFGYLFIFSPILLSFLSFFLHSLVIKQRRCSEVNVVFFVNNSLILLAPSSPKQLSIHFKSFNTHNRYTQNQLGFTS